MATAILARVVLSWGTLHARLRALSWRSDDRTQGCLPLPGEVPSAVSDSRWTYLVSGRQSATCYLAMDYGNKQGRPTVHYLCYSCCKPNRIKGLHRERIALDSNTIILTLIFNLPQLIEIIAVTRFMAWCLERTKIVIFLRNSVHVSPCLVSV